MYEWMNQSINRRVGNTQPATARNDLWHKQSVQKQMIEALSEDR